MLGNHMSQQQLPPERSGALYERVVPHDFNPLVRDAEALMRREALIAEEQRLAVDEYRLKQIAEDNPRDVEALTEWVEHEKQRDRMRGEIEILDEIIAALYADHAPLDIIQLAQVLEDRALAKSRLEELQAQQTLAA